MATKQKRTTLVIKSFPYNHSISEVLAGICNTKERDFVRVKAKILNFYIVKYGYKAEKSNSCNKVISVQP